MDSFIAALFAIAIFCAVRYAARSSAMWYLIGGLLAFVGLVVPAICFMAVGLLMSLSTPRPPPE
jgi:hypothetical protein